MVSVTIADESRRARKLYEETLRAKLEVTSRTDFIAMEWIQSTIL